MQQKAIFSSDLRLGNDMTTKKLKKTKRRLKRFTFLGKEYLLTLSANADDVLDIIQVKQLVWPYYKEHPLHVVGVAASYDEAVLLVQKLVEECMAQTGKLDLKEYLECRFLCK